MAIAKYTAKRVGQTLIVLLFVTVFAFFVVRLAPGNPALMMVPDGSPPEIVETMEIEMGLDRPLYEQYLKYLGNVLQGNLGKSMIYKTDAAALIVGRLPATGILGLASVGVSLLLAIPLGIRAGSRQGSFTDLFSMLFSLLGQSMSQLWLGVLLMYVFAVRLGWLPALGYGGLAFLILPAISMGYPNAAQFTRLTRSGMIDVLSEDYITATYAKGISRSEVNHKYAFKNALIPLITILGMELGITLTGAVVIETLFAWPGLGQLTFQAIGNRDYVLVQSILLVAATLVAIINLCVDIINSFIDPRVTLE